MFDPTIISTDFVQVTPVDPQGTFETVIVKLLEEAFVDFFVLASMY